MVRAEVNGAMTTTYNLTISHLVMFGMPSYVCHTTTKQTLANALQYMQELRACGKLEHDGIVTYFEHGAPICSAHNATHYGVSSISCCEFLSDDEDED